MCRVKVFRWFHVGIYWLGSILLGLALVGSVPVRALDGDPEAAVASAKGTLVDGVVQDAAGAVIPGAKVQFVLHGAAAGQAKIVVADGLGAFHLTLPPGQYRLSAVQEGFEEKDQVLDVATQAPLHLVLTLKVQGNVQSITVEASTGYAEAVETSATRIPMHMLDIPQSVYSVTSQSLRDRGSDSLKEALAGVPGVEPVLGEGRRDQFAIRGFTANTDLYMDGIRDDAQYFRDLSNTNQIEVVEGPAAVLYGRGSSGGLINRITKKPQLEGLQEEFGVTVGSYGDQRLTGDLADSWLGNRLGVRLTGAAEASGSHRDFFYMRRYAFAPSLRWRPSDRTDIYAQVQRIRDERLPDRGVAAVSGPLGTVPIGNYYGYSEGEGAVPHDFSHQGATDATLDIRHDFEDGWHLHNVARQARANVNFSNLYLNVMTINGVPVFGASFAPGRPGARAYATGSEAVNPIITRGQYNAHTNQLNLFDQAEAYRSGRWLGMGHLILVGSEYGRQTIDRLQFNGTAPDTTLYNPVPSLAPTLGTSPRTNSRFFGQTAAVYTQDLIQLAPRWNLLAGVRFDDFRQNLNNRLAGGVSLARVDNSWSPRVGLLFQPAGWSTAYFSYSRNFDPSGEALNLASNAAQLKPEKTENFEGGTKFASLDGKLVSSLAVYRLGRTNIKTVDPQNPTQLISIGEQRTNGASVSFQGAVARRWIFTGGYAWQDARIVKSNTTSNGVALEGRRPLDVPVNSGSLWSTYRFENGFGFGGGLIFNTDSFAANDNLVPLPGYTRLDTTVSWHRRKYDFDAHLNNLTNTRYYDSSHSDLELFPGAPVSGSMTIRYRF